MVWAVEAPESLEKKILRPFGAQNDKRWLFILSAFPFVILSVSEGSFKRLRPAPLGRVGGPSPSDTGAVAARQRFQP